MTADTDKSLRRGIAWLIGAQGDDGGWHSQTYGALRGGAATTALAVYALSEAPLPVRDRLTDTIEPAERFLARGLALRDTIAGPDGTLDYPVYATAQVLLAARSLPLRFAPNVLEQLATYLLDAQLTARQGFAPSDKHYGGWDLAGASPGSRPSTGSNTSYLRFAVEALAENARPVGQAGVRTSQAERRRAAREAALTWLGRCQRRDADGGFAFAPDPSALENKAQWEDADHQRPRSYGTATCDGLRALVACGVPADDPRRVAAARWLDQHWSVARVPGFPADDEGQAWSAGLRFYYAETLAGAIEWFTPPGQWVARRDELAATIVVQQRDDGSWRNESNRMREDDPLVATSLAVAALGICQRV